MSLQRNLHIIGTPAIYESLMLLFYIVLFCFCMLFAIFVPRSSRINKILLLFFTVSLILIAVFHDYGPDRETYKVLFDEQNDGIENSFLFISKRIQQYSNDPVWLFLVYAVISIPLKVYAIGRYASFIWLSMLVYLSRFFVLHDVIQIRCAIASGILLVLTGIVYPKKLCFKLIAIGGVSAATYFHRSGLIVSLLLFLRSRHVKKIFWLSLIPTCYLLYFMGVTMGNVVANIPVPSIQLLYDRYISAQEIGLHSDINVFNILQITNCLICVYFLLQHDFYAKKYKYFTLLIKVYTISCCCFVLFSDIPVMGFRISELLGIVEILLIPLLVYGTSKIISVPAVILYCSLRYIFIYQNLLLIAK